jgi:hypothetical protein
MPHQDNKYLFQIIIHEHDCMVILPSVEFEYSEYFAFLDFLLSFCKNRYFYVQITSPPRKKYLSLM